MLKAVMFYILHSDLGTSIAIAIITTITITINSIVRALLNESYSHFFKLYSALNERIKQNKRKEQKYFLLYESIWASGHSSSRAFEHQGISAAEHQSILASENFSSRAFEHQEISAAEHQSIWASENFSIRAFEHQGISAAEHQSILASGNFSIRAESFMLTLQQLVAWAVEMIMIYAVHMTPIWTMRGTGKIRLCRCAPSVVWVKRNVLLNFYCLQSTVQFVRAV